MTPAELRCQARKSRWLKAIGECRSSGLSVREWCRERGITPSTYYRWERVVFSKAEATTGVHGTQFIELSVVGQKERNVPERTRTFRHTLRRGRQCGDILGPEPGTVESFGGGTAGMLNDFTGADKEYIACGYTDLRRGIDGLSRMVSHNLESVK